MKSEAERIFAALAAELEEGRGDPEALFAAHPALAGELRALHRGWCALDSLFRELASDGSLVAGVASELRVHALDERAGAALARLARVRFEERYELGPELGRGGMGLVRSVTDRVLGRELALKTIRAVDAGQRQQLLLRFMEEAAVVGRLEHPGIVPIHDLGLDTDGEVYFTMPRVRGRTLEEALTLARDGREGWTRARVLEVLLRVADAVAYAHSRGVLHRDLKPANVMVGRFGEVYVMDWGLARALGGSAEEPAASHAEGGLTLFGEVLGTPAYMAPEQAAGRAEELDERCDVYALGAILYECLAGARPFGACSSREALALLTREAPPDVERVAPGAPEELCAIVRRAMAREREERYPTVAGWAADVRAFIDGRVVRAHRTGAWIEARKWVRRNRGVAASLAIALIVLVAGLATTLVLVGENARERANVFRLAQASTLADLIARAERAWPAHPERIPELRAWQSEAGALVRALDADPDGGGGGLRVQLAALSARADGWSDSERWWHDELAKLVAGIEALADPAHGLIGAGLGPHGFGIGRRIELAERLRAEAERPEVRTLWDEARASVRADPRFAGLELAQQVGLVPLGPDPRSGLWEFAHALSGAAPARDERGELVLGAESALVLVLLPPREFLMGSQVDDPDGPNFTAAMHQTEYPLHRRSLTAFFLAKHEVTQAQWERITGVNPSYFTAAPDAARLPVDTITWTDARSSVARVGLRLPSEAEWEYACRAGTTSEYYWGATLQDIERHENTKDFMGTREGSTYLVAREVPADHPLPVQFEQDHIRVEDGFAGTAPVGSFLPNPWGLHDVIGNVAEWCEDRFDLYPGAHGTPQAEPLPAREMRVMRGASHARVNVRSADRGRQGPDFAWQGIGVRPARGVDP
jgi:formylglycine-generating enzyme required for sulfatase activity